MNVNQNFQVTATAATATSQQLSHLSRPLDHHAQGPNIPFGVNPSLRYIFWMWKYSKSRELHITYSIYIWETSNNPKHKNAFQRHWTFSETLETHHFTRITEAKRKQNGSNTNLRKVSQSKPLESFGKYSEWISIDLIVDALAREILSDAPAMTVWVKGVPSFNLSEDAGSG